MPLMVRGHAGDAYGGVLAQGNESEQRAALSVGAMMLMFGGVGCSSANCGARPSGRAPRIAQVIAPLASS